MGTHLANAHIDPDNYVFYPAKKQADYYDNDPITSLTYRFAGLYALFNTTIIPTLTEKISGMFNYAG